MNATVKLDSWDKRVKVEESAYYWRGEPQVTPPTELPARSQHTVVELFSGCGGTSVGFEMAGFHIHLGADLHGPSLDTFRHNHPGAGSILGDLRHVTSQTLLDVLGDHPIDVLIAGVPCQGFSLNNRKRHDEDERNDLYKEFVRFVAEARPRALVLENVSGMRSARGGSLVSQIASEISAAAGFQVQSAMFNAHEFGVPQRRARLVFIGSVGRTPFDLRSVRATHGPGLLPFTTVFDALSDLPSLGPGERKTKYATKPRSPYQTLMRASAGSHLTNHVAPKHPAATVARIGRTPPGKPMYPRFKQRIRLSWEGLSPTQVSGGIRPQFQLGHPEDARGLSIRERCRLQSIPDHFEVLGGIVQGRVQTGNAVPPLLARAIALALKDRL